MPPCDSIILDSILKHCLFSNVFLKNQLTQSLSWLQSISIVPSSSGKMASNVVKNVAVFQHNWPLFLCFCFRRRVVVGLQQVLQTSDVLSLLQRDAKSQYQWYRVFSYPCMMANQPSICWVSGNMLLSSLMGNSTQVRVARTAAAAKAQI